jgi:hypothetical protein
MARTDPGGAGALTSLPACIWSIGGALILTSLACRGAQTPPESVEPVLQSVSTVSSNPVPSATAAPEPPRAARSLCLARGASELPQVMASRDASTVVLHIGAIGGRDADVAMWMAPQDGHVVEEKRLSSAGAVKALRRRLALEGLQAVTVREFWPDRWETEAAVDDTGGVVDVGIFDISALAEGGVRRLAGRYRLGLPEFPAKSDSGRLVQSGPGSRCAMGVRSIRTGTTADGRLAVVELLFSVADVCDEAEGKVCSTFVIRL